MFDSRVFVVADSDHGWRRHVADQLTADGGCAFIADDRVRTVARCAKEAPDLLLLGELDEPAGSLELLREIRAGTGRRVSRSVWRCCVRPGRRVGSRCARSRRAATTSSPSRFASWSYARACAREREPAPTARGGWRSRSTSGRECGCGHAGRASAQGVRAAVRAGQRPRRACSPSTSCCATSGASAPVGRDADAGLARLPPARASSARRRAATGQRVGRRLPAAGRDRGHRRHTGGGVTPGELDTYLAVLFGTARPRTLVEVRWRAEQRRYAPDVRASRSARGRGEHDRSCRRQARRVRRRVAGGRATSTATASTT